MSTPTATPPPQPAAQTPAPATAPATPQRGGFLKAVKGQMAQHDMTKPPTATATATATAAQPQAQPSLPNPLNPTPAPTAAPTQQAPAAQPAQPTQPAKPPEPVANPDEDDIPESFSNAKAENWKKMREIRTRLEAQNKTLTDQLKVKDEEITRYKTKPEIPQQHLDEFEAVKKERDQYATIVERHAIAEDPRFQATYDKPMEQILASAKAVMGDKGDQLTAWMTAPDTAARTKAIKEIAGELDAVDGGRIGALLQKFEELRADKQSKLDDSKNQAKLARELDTKQRAEQEKQRAAQVEELIAKGLKKGASDYPAFSEDAAKQAFTKFMTGKVDADTFIEIGLKAADYERLQKSVATLQDQLKEAQAAVAAYSQGNPSVRTPAGQQAQPNTVNTPYGPSRFKAAVLDKFQQGPK